MTIALCTLVLNEMEWLPKLYQQHRDWPELTRWVFVESADRAYADINPHLVSSQGLSVDGTSEFLSQLAQTDSRISYIPHGFSSHKDLAQGKCESRNCYLQALEDVKPDFFVVVDADEFYTQKSQRVINDLMKRLLGYTAFVFKHRDIWRPASICSEPLFQYEVTGGFWDIPYCRCWRWITGLSYKTNHNTPEVAGRGLDRLLVRLDKVASSPEFIHMGFACNPEIRAAKNRYYEHRGEAVDRKRSWYCDSRRAFETWQPGDELPNSAKVIPFTGDIPEVFLDSTSC